MVHTCFTCGGRIGIAPYKIQGRPEEHCSRRCVEKFQDRVLAPPKRRQRVKARNDAAVPGTEKVLCDYCQKPVILNWRGHNGDYCSNTCLEAAEPDHVDNAKENQMGTAAEATATVVAKKKKVKTGTAKADGKGKVDVKKGAAKAAKRGKAEAEPKRGRASELSGKIIKVLKDAEFRGKRGELQGLIKNGLTVEAYCEKATAKGLPAPTAHLRWAESEGYISLKTAK
jgi:hypothetical protein